MNAGLPGTGLGGLFYILGALWMPFDAAYEHMRGRKTENWPVIARQAGIALGVIAALWLTGWAVGYMVALAPASTLPGSQIGGSAGAEVSSVVRWAGVVGTIGVLAAVIGIVQVMRFLVPRGSGSRAEQS